MIQKLRRRIVAAIAALGIALTPFMLTASASASENTGYYDCSGWSGVATVCADATTGYGPVVFVYNSAGTAVWASVVYNVDFSDLASDVSGAEGKDDNYTRVHYGLHPLIPSIDFEVGYNYTDGWEFAAVGMSQDTMNAMRWVSNYYGTNAGRAVN